MKLLRCTQAQKRSAAVESLQGYVQNGSWRCQWDENACHADEGICTAEEVASHMSQHLHSSSMMDQFRWDTCAHRAHNELELHLHITDSHGILTEKTIPTNVEFCFECAKWTTSIIDWELHAAHHSQNPDIAYGSVQLGGILAAPRRCPYVQMLLDYTYPICELDRSCTSPAILLKHGRKPPLHESEACLFKDLLR